jgi:hypothetical protein
MPASSLPAPTVFGTDAPLLETIMGDTPAPACTPGRVAHDQLALGRHG